MIKTNTPDVEVPVTADVMRTMLSSVKTRDDKVDKLPAPTVDPADSDIADTWSLLPAGVMLASASLPRTPRDRTTFRGSAAHKNISHRYNH